MAPSLQRNHMFALAILLAVAAFLSTTNPSAAQQSSTSATLPAPVLTARASENAIELNWQAVDGAARYELASRPRGGDWLYLDNGTLTATTYTQTDPTAATTYAYQIRAVSETGEPGAWSQRVYATYAGTLVAPSLTVQAAEGAFDLNWASVAGADGYQLIVWSGAGEWQQLGGGTLAGTTYNHPELDTGTTYYYSIRAVNETEVSPWSQQVSETVTDAQSSSSTPTPTPTPTLTLDSTPTSTLDSTPTPTPTPTSTPSTLSTTTPTPTSTASTLSTATPTPSPTSAASTPPAPALTVYVTEDAIEVSWEAVTGAVRYVLWVWTSSGGPQRLDNGSLTATTFNHDEMVAGTNYHYTARALNAAGESSAWSAYVLAAIPAEISPASQIFDNVSPAIAFVETEIASGSGVLVEGGWIVTNAHVVWPSNAARVVFPDGTAYDQLPVRYWDLVADLAVFGPVSAPAQTATMLDGENIPIGSDVYLIGYPGEYEQFPQPTMTAGILSRLRQWEPGGLTFIQTDSTITGGQSGGALVSDTGAVIGISGFKVFGEFGLVTSSADIWPRIQQLIAGQDPSGLGDRRIPTEGAALRHDLTLNNYWDDMAYVIYEPPGTQIRFSLLGENNGALSIYDAFGINGQTFDVFNITGFEYGAYIIGKITPHFLIVRQKALTPGNFILAANHNIVPFNDPDRGRQLQVGQSTHGNIDFPRDTDHFFLDLAQGETVEILAQSVLADMYLTVSLGSPAQAISNDDSVGLLRRDSRILFRAPITARYVVIVRDFAGSAPAGYIITVNRFSRY